MTSVGVDIGSTTTKVVILRDGEIAGRTVVPSGGLPGQNAEAALTHTLEAAGIRDQDVDCIVTTGYGRRLVDFGDKVLTEIKACAAGVRFVTGHDGIFTIIDVGGQDTKVIALNDDGDVEDFSMNDKCAAGTGRFLEVLCQKLDLDYETFVQEALGSETTLQMNSTCAVFAESEVVGLLARGEQKGDIAMAAHQAIANRVSAMVRRTARRGDYCFVGGGARNGALVKAVQEALNNPLHVAPDPQVVVALGAAACGLKG